MGQSDWARIGVVSDFFHDAGPKIPAFSRNWKGLSSFFRPWPVLFRDGQGVSFFQKRIAPYGEVKSKLGSELEIYAEKTWEDFFRRVHKAMNVIQPLVFVFVALVIVLLYAAMLLPIYQNMEVHL